ncbi:aminodeoxychorismate synthase component I [Streptomyces jumonjinensis]|uniref:aminodeoxychorismate synthase component I n=1 Tax=Streptomyces jumonjinensis TaxID=1945 RepID=UPI0037ADA27B
MRILLVDNYDSFTYNLFHLLADVAGTEPVVVRNDDRLPADPTAGFDAVVLSPGPGTPARESDVGLCRSLVENSSLPLLGICLGHQGLALWHGGTVERAPEPRHGRLSPVEHDGTGLFAGLPSPFQAVRYHSLTATSLPAELEPTAWTPDGVLMGLRHRRRPQWGMQFHPESICTEHGRELLANFVDMAAGHDRAGHDRARRATRAVLPAPVGGGRPTAHRTPGVDTPQPSTPQGPRSTDGTADRALSPARAPRRLRVHTKALTTRWADESVFDQLFRDRPYAYWLDSSGRGPGTGRFSVMGDATGPLARVARADVHTGTVTVSPEGGGHPAALDGAAETIPFLEWLDRDLRSLDVQLPELPGDFALGWVGYLGYELKAQTGGEAAHRTTEPDAELVFADRAVVFDHLEGRTHLLALSDRDAPPGADETAALDWLGATAGRLSRLADTASAPVRPASPATWRLRPRDERETYLSAVRECQEEISAGETYEVCLTNALTAAGELDSWQAYRFLRRRSPVPFGALLQFGRQTVLSTSPERFLRVGADRWAESRPIKGTRPRGGTPEEDRALRDELLKDEKDRSENLMIVDLVRNDLGRCAELGSVTVDDLFRVESYATVHQLVSTVRARLRPDASAVDCVRAAFPGGSMTGAPKIRTMQIIDRLEGEARGVYSGAIGYFSLSGAADLSIVIRTVVVTPGRIRYGTGGAIVALSDPQEEFAETVVKAAPLLALLGAGFPGADQEPEPPAPDHHGAQRRTSRASAG